MKDRCVCVCVCVCVRVAVFFPWALANILHYLSDTDLSEIPSFPDNDDWACGLFNSLCRFVTKGKFFFQPSWHGQQSLLHQLNFDYVFLNWSLQVYQIHGNEYKIIFLSVFRYGLKLRLVQIWLKLNFLWTSGLWRLENILSKNDLLIRKHFVKHFLIYCRFQP